jgi:hypothetical protein
MRCDLAQTRCACTTTCCPRAQPSHRRRRRTSRSAGDAASCDDAAPDAAPLGCASAGARAKVVAADGAGAPAGSGAAAALLATPRRPRGKAARSTGTSLFADLPDYLRDNEYITRYYRADYSVRESLASLFRLHNETGNIWTHLTGARPRSALSLRRLVPVLQLLGAQRRAVPGASAAQDPDRLSRSAGGERGRRPRGAGALLFAVLTGVTLWARPAPLALGGDALRALEERLAAAGRGGLLVPARAR